MEGVYASIKTETVSKGDPVVGINTYSYTPTIKPSTLGTLTELWADDEQTHSGMHCRYRVRLA